MVALKISSASADQPNTLVLQCRDQAEMGTNFKICVYAKSEDQLNLDRDLRQSFQILHRIDAWMSDWKPETELNRINRAAGGAPQVVTKELFDVLTFSQQVSLETQGAFDITFNVFWGLYNFKPGQERLPSDEEIAERLPLIDYRKIELNQDKMTVRLGKPGMKIGLGGLGQGYGVKKVVEFLRPKYNAGFVDGSGDTYFWGKKPNGELWTVSIRDPRDHQKIVGRLYGTDMAVTTSGDDEKFFIRNGVRYHHIIDPKVGKPALKARQVTVIAKDPFEADAFDTASFVMGFKDATPILKKRGLEAVFVDDGGVQFTSGLKKVQTQWGEVLSVNFN